MLHFLRGLSTAYRKPAALREATPPATRLRPLYGSVDRTDAQDMAEDARRSLLSGALDDPLVDVSGLQCAHRRQAVRSLVKLFAMGLPMALGVLALVQREGVGGWVASATGAVLVRGADASAGADEMSTGDVATAELRAQTLEALVGPARLLVVWAGVAVLRWATDMPFRKDVVALFAQRLAVYTVVVWGLVGAPLRLAAEAPHGALAAMFVLFCAVAFNAGGIACELGHASVKYVQCVVMRRRLLDGKCTDIEGGLEEIGLRV